MAVVSGLPLSREASLNSPPSTPTKRRDHPTQSLEIVKLCCGLRQEILDPETALALHRDDAGTFSNTGSIGGVTALVPYAQKTGKRAAQIVNWVASAFQKEQIDDWLGATVLLSGWLACSSSNRSSS
jgi:hypothetical protein